MFVSEHPLYLALLFILGAQQQANQSPYVGILIWIILCGVQGLTQCWNEQSQNHPFDGHRAFKKTCPNCLSLLKVESGILNDVLFKVFNFKMKAFQTLDWSILLPKKLEYIGRVIYIYMCYIYSYQNPKGYVLKCSPSIFRLSNICKSISKNYTMNTYIDSWIQHLTNIYWILG